MAKVICYDIDGVLTVESDTKHEDLPGSYIYRSPNLRVRDQMLKAIKEGWTVVLFTGRREAQRRITEDWLHAHGFHYHFLIMGKPYFTYVIDDRALSLNEFDGLLSEGESDGEYTFSAYRHGANSTLKGNDGDPTINDCIIRND